MPCSIDPQTEIHADAKEILRRRIVKHPNYILVQERLLKPLGIHCVECASFVELVAITDRIRWLDLY